MPQSQKILIPRTPLKKARKPIEVPLAVQKKVRKVAPKRVDRPLTPKEVCTIIYADEYLIAVNKAAGCPVVPTGLHRARSVVGAVAKQGYGITYPINLLDSEGTGLVLLSRSPEAAKSMRWNWRSDLCKREFVVVASGDINGARGRITLPIGTQKEGNRTRHAVMALDQGGKAAVTAWKLIARGRTMSRLLVTLGGNRTHQIRIHLAAIGFPVVGDKRYGVEMTNVPLEALVEMPAKYGDATKLAPGQIALHCAMIRIPHPMTDQMMEFRAPVPRVIIGLMPGAWVLDGT